MKKIAKLFIIGLLLASCESASLEAPGKEFGLGKVENFTQEPDIEVALYKEEELKSGQKVELTFGRMDAQFVTLDGIQYMVDWNDTDDFKTLKRGDDIHFRQKGYYARIKKYKKNMRVIHLNEY